MPYLGSFLERSDASAQPNGVHPSTHIEEPLYQVRQHKISTDTGHHDYTDRGTFPGLTRGNLEAQHAANEILISDGTWDLYAKAMSVHGELRILGVCGNTQVSCYVRRLLVDSGHVEPWGFTSDYAGVEEEINEGLSNGLAWKQLPM
ncbi:MAG: hypothetical protein Q9166_001657 [cf. Caloplaca sp. 2 TL-2023]